MKCLFLSLVLLFFAPFIVQSATALQIDPQSYDFGKVAVGETRSREFRLSNKENIDVRLISIALQNAPSFFRITENTCGDILGRNSNCRVRVEFSPLAVGSWTAELSILSTDSPFQPIKTQLQGTGGTGASEYPPPSRPAAV